MRQLWARRRLLPDESGVPVAVARYAQSIPIWGFAFVISARLWESEGCNGRLGIDKSYRGTRNLHSRKLAIPAGIGFHLSHRVFFARDPGQRVDREARHYARSRVPARTQTLGPLPILADSDLMLAEHQRCLYPFSQLDRRSPLPGPGRRVRARPLFDPLVDLLFVP